MIRIYRSPALFSEQLFSQVVKSNEIEFHFEEKTVDELLQSEYDLIEVPENCVSDVLQRFSTLDVYVEATKEFDVIVRKKAKMQWYPLFLGTLALQALIEKNKIRLNQEQVGVLVGLPSFLIGHAIALARLGFKKILLLDPSEKLTNEQVDKLRRLLFQIQIEIVELNHLKNLKEMASLLLIDFNHDEFVECAEHLNYFNFLSPEGAFLDLQDFVRPQLKQEAEKANLLALSSIEYYTLKYGLVKNII